MADPIDASGFAAELAAKPDVLRARSHVLDAQNRALKTIQVVGRRFEIRPAPVRANTDIVIIRKRSPVQN